MLLKVLLVIAALAAGSQAATKRDAANPVVRPHVHACLSPLRALLPRRSQRPNNVEKPLLGGDLGTSPCSRSGERMH